MAASTRAVDTRAVDTSAVRLLVENARATTPFAHSHSRIRVIAIAERSAAAWLLVAVLPECHAAHGKHQCCVDDAHRDFVGDLQVIDSMVVCSRGRGSTSGKIWSSKGWKRSQRRDVSIEMLVRKAGVLREGLFVRLGWLW
jgi:hypothetical protein